MDDGKKWGRKVAQAKEAKRNEVREKWKRIWREAGQLTAACRKVGKQTGL